MPNRKGRGEPQFLSPQDLADIRRITERIMQGTELQRPAFRQYIQGILAEEIVAAAQKHEAKLAAEEIHTWEFGQHHISECRIDWCGRYRGQRRDSGVSQ